MVIVGDSVIVADETLVVSNAIPCNWCEIFITGFVQLADKLFAALSISLASDNPTSLKLVAEAV